MRQTTWSKVLSVMVAAVMVGALAVDDGTTPPATPPAGGGNNNNQNGGGRQRGGGGAGGNFNPQQFQQQRMDRLKTALGVNDDEWKALEPKVTAVDTARRASFAGGGGGGFGRRGQGGQNGQTPDPATMTDLQKKQADLRKLLDDPNADAKAIQEALKAYRDERAKNTDALKKAQSDLKELLTAKQEAIMVLQGMLE